MQDSPAPARLRLDVWLDVVCLFKTRSEAQKACRMGRVQVNGERAKAHRDVKPGDKVDIRRPLGRLQRVIVRGVAGKHLKKADARLLFEDVSPLPTAEELELRRLAALARPHQRAARAPDKRQRRAMRRIKEFGEND